MTNARDRWRPDWLRPGEDPHAFDPAWPPWRPSGLPEDDPTELSYVVVDDLAEGTALLAVSEWPRVDPGKRIRFPVDERARLVRVDADELLALLRQERRRFAGRPLRIGDVFAARARLPELPPPQSREEEAEKAEETRGGSLEWLEPPVYDLTAQGREVAKTALAAAVSPLLTAEEARLLTGETAPLEEEG